MEENDTEFSQGQRIVHHPGALIYAEKLRGQAETGKRISVTLYTNSRGTNVIVCINGQLEIKYFSFD